MAGNNQKIVGKPGKHYTVLMDLQILVYFPVVAYVIINIKTKKNVKYFSKVLIDIEFIKVCTVIIVCSCAPQCIVKVFVLFLFSGTMIPVHLGGVTPTPTVS